MQEDFLHYLWEFQLFDKKDLRTNTGERIVIFKTGERNADSGADFSNTHLKIGTRELVGTLEVHKKPSEWYAHKHDKDKAYQSVILHLVWKADTQEPSHIPILELYQRVSKRFLVHYQEFLHSKEPMPCSAQFGKVSHTHKMQMIQQSFSKRFERKSAEFLFYLQKNKQDWEESSYQLVGEKFGFKINSAPFAQLCRVLPLKILRKHADQIFQLEALIFGMAGFLERDFEDEYGINLKKEFQFLSKKYKLENHKLKLEQWKFSRLRPANFPTIRLAQFAAFIQKNEHFFSKIITIQDVKQFEGLFKIEQSAYWKLHYNFGKKSKKDIPSLGKSSINVLIINVLTPILWAYGQEKNQSQFAQKAINLVQNLPCEINKITKIWNSLGMYLPNAYFSQASIEWYNQTCKAKKCLQCQVGKSILKPS
jgi:hypothetical protein